MRARGIMTSPVATVRTVASAMTPHPATVSPFTPFKDILQLLTDRGISAVPVVSATGLVVGVVSEADLLANLEHRISPRRWHQARRSGIDRLTAEELMSSPVDTVSCDCTLAHAARLLIHTGRRRLFVVDDGRLVGVLARRDVLAILCRPDEEILTDIEHRAGEPIAGQSRSLRIGLDRGVVTLTGRLPAHSDIEATVASISQIPGVIDVRDRLQFTVDDRQYWHRSNRSSQ